jgi:hypothetical protein
MKIETIKTAYFFSEHVYNEVTFVNYVVELEGHDTPYKLCKFKDNKQFPHVKEGDKITCEIEGDKLKNVKVLTEIKSDKTTSETRASRAVEMYRRRMEIENNSK